MSKRWLGVLAGTCLMVGCTQGPAATGFEPNKGGFVFADGRATLELKTEVIPGGLSTQDIVNNYTVASINHLIIKLFKISGNTEQPVLQPNTTNQVTKDIPKADFSKFHTLSGLNANATYRIRCYAYKAEGTADPDLISTSDAGSYVDVTLTDDDRPTMATLKVKLIDVVFNGMASSTGVAITNGGYTTPGPETID